MNKHKSKASTAFSLIELSIVILIVGIIIAGITQSSRLVRQSKLKSAQNLTTSSPVTGIRGLALWLETTQDASFPASGLDDESPLLQWNDSNSQTASKFFAIPASGVTTTGSAAIKYDNEGINGLPSIKFDGGNTTGNIVPLSSILSLSTSATSLVASPVVTTADPNNVNAFTAFMVYKLDDTATGADYTVLYNGVTGINGWGYLRDNAATNKRTIQVGAAKPVATAALPTTQEIATITYSGYNANNLLGTKTTYLYVNGGNSFDTIADNTIAGNNGQATGASATTVVAPTASMFIGGGSSGPLSRKPWKGLISEVIIFDTVLKNQDLKDVASYLSKKYNIPLS
jgi:type II secretory pathway pseudopilin PulG